MGVPCRPGCYPGCCRGRALGRRAPAAGPGNVGERCWLRAGGVGPGHGSAGPGPRWKGIRLQQRDLLRKLYPKTRATAGTQTRTARQRSRYALYNLAFTVVGTVTRVRSGLRNPRRLTVLAIVGEAPTVVFYAPRVAWAVQRRRPRIVVGSALAVAGSVARLRAASAEPLR